jgi:hypothetical protein
LANDLPNDLANHLPNDLPDALRQDRDRNALMWTSTARFLRPAALAGGLLAGAFGGAACAQPAPAPQPEGERKPASSLLGAIVQGPKLRTTAPEPKDWVKASRPAEAREPRRVQPEAEPRRPILSPEQIRAREAELDNVRARHDRLAERKPARGPFASAAPPAPPAAQKTSVGCAIACPPALGVKEKK